MAALIFAILVSFVIAGWLWFYVVRPIMEDWGVIRDGDVNHSQSIQPVVMSNTAESEARLSPSSLQTAAVQTPDQTRAGKAELLTLYKMLRAADISRDAARTALNGVGVPLDNNLWVAAAPAAQADEDTLITPFAGRATRRSYYPDNPDLEYQQPSA